LAVRGQGNMNPGHVVRGYRGGSLR
jgi:hypothetical protein